LSYSLSAVNIVSAAKVLAKQETFTALKWLSAQNLAAVATNFGEILLFDSREGLLVSRFALSE
jgi:hypothetical protein